jgi:hypothetical protein
MIEKVTPWTPSVELPEALRGSYGKEVNENYAWAVFGNLLFVKAFKNCNFTPRVDCYKLNLLGGGEFNGTLTAGEAAIGILK